MNSLKDILILVFLLGSSAICFASHATTHTVSNYNDNHHQHSEIGLERILKAVHGSESRIPSHTNGQNFEARKQRDYGSFQSQGYSYSPNHNHQGISNNNYNNNNNGYQYIPPNNGANGYHYENPSEAAQNVIGLDSFGSNYLNNNNGYQISTAHQLSNSAKESQGQSSNSGYHYEAPSAQNYNFRPASIELGYNYDKPKYTSSSSSNFKGNSYLPQASLSSSYSSYQNQQNQDYQGQIHSTAVNGYQYESPKYSGYNYYKPQQQSGGISESSFKGQSYLPTKPTSQGYSYEKPSTAFKGESYLPLPSGW